MKASAGPSRQQQRGCGTKVPYLSALLADNAATLHAWAGRPGMVGYRCQWCPDWHVGHPNPRHREPSPQPELAAATVAAA